MANRTLMPAMTGATLTTTAKRVRKDLRPCITIVAMLVVAVSCRPVEPESCEQSQEDDGSAEMTPISWHLPSTPQDLRNQIDKLLESASDQWSGARGARAVKKLVRIGAPSMPAILHKMGDLDFASEEDRSAMTMLTEMLWKISRCAPEAPPGNWISRVGLYGTESNEINACTYFRQRWLEWFMSPAGQFFITREKAELKPASPLPTR